MNAQEIAEYYETIMRRLVGPNWRVRCNARLTIQDGEWPCDTVVVRTIIQNDNRRFSARVGVWPKMAYHDADDNCREMFDQLAHKALRGG